MGDGAVTDEKILKLQGQIIDLIKGQQNKKQKKVLKKA